MTEQKLPTAADEARFWALVESAWEALGPEAAALRRATVAGEAADPYALDKWLNPFLAQLRVVSAQLSQQDLVDIDRVVERKLYDIDRADIQAVTDGSDDGFLYCRGYIVALGREFYEAVSADPERAIEDAECESICYFFAHLHGERFGGWPQTGSGITRESVSNPAGWPA
ncbi:DUF4240 domain-containing protein [Actinoplanes sp. CA-142083]|uniref:DUF4240 domain-containing protein n=1 Tax=Actinoplanes sp. CA-142083 TaxID=3239903 RepID=UPI003D8CD16E